MRNQIAEQKSRWKEATASLGDSFSTWKTWICPSRTEIWRI